MSDTSNLTLLGSADTRYPSEYAPQILERFANRFPDHPYEVELECPEFTSLCPKTGQPDFARILNQVQPRCFPGRIKIIKNLPVFL
jgi:7-cyano-7-deazaguanine reductase